jgi:multicomponent K+:H+ antiporter subunit G
MMAATELPGWAALLVSILVLAGTGFTLTGAVGLLRFKTFYERVHAPTLGTTFGMASIVTASFIFFSVVQARLPVYVVLIAVFVTVTTPVALMLLVRASRFRERMENDAEKPGMDAPAAADDTQ